MLARLLLAFDLELYETDRVTDIDVVRDCFIGEVSPASKGVCVRRRQIEIESFSGFPRFAGIT